jgi:hypothetical protein
MAAVFLDDSLRSPFGPTFSRSTRFALLSGLRRNDENPAIRLKSVPFVSESNPFNG